LLKAEAAFEKSNNYVFLADCQKAIGDVYQNDLSNYPLAMEYLLKAIQSAERANYVLRQIDIFRSLGSLYSYIGDHTNALLYLKRQR
jgi:tetratricopeptide (TPR) repeat protein